MDREQLELEKLRLEIVVLRKPMYKRFTFWLSTMSVLLALILLCHLAKKSLVARICNSMLHIGQRQTNRMATDFLMPIERTGCARTS